MSEFAFDPDDILPPDDNWGDGEGLDQVSHPTLDDGDTPSRRQSDATTVVNLALEQFTLCVDEDGLVFAIPRNGPMIAQELRGSRHSLVASLSTAFFDMYGRVVTSSAVADAIKVLEGRGQRLEPSTVHLRSGQVGDRVYVDLGRPDGQSVEVTPTGWRIVSQPPVIFRRTALMQEMPLPDPTGSMDGLWEAVNVAPEDRILLIAWMVTTFLPELQCPALALTGEQGAGKSWAARALVRIVDPLTPALRRPPRSDVDWPAIVRASRVVALDNLSAISPDMSDMFCRAVTGDGEVRRQLYTDGALVPYAYRRALILNGITLGMLRGDLAERVLMCELSPIDPSRRRLETELRAAFEQGLPGILGTVMDCLSKVLAMWPSTHLTQYPRMAEFARVLACLDRALGSQGLARYEEQVRQRASDVVGNDHVSRALQREIDEPWTGSANELLALIAPWKPEGYEARFWPSRPQAMTDYLKRQAPGLRAAGWQITDHLDRNRKTTVWTLVPPNHHEEKEHIDD